MQMRVNPLGAYLWTLVAVAAGCLHGLKAVGIVILIQFGVFTLLELVIPMGGILVEWVKSIQEKRRRNR